MNTIIAVDPGEAPPLKEGYYLDNVHCLLDYVVAQYSDLLTAEEIEYFHLIKSLPLQAQYLYFRCVMRRGQNFRVDKLRYKEIPQLAEACDVLCDKKLLLRSTSLNLDLDLKLFTKAEWCQKIGEHIPDASVTKICEQHFQGTTLKSMKRDQLHSAVAILSQEFPNLLNTNAVVRLQNESLFSVFCLLYFGNLRQNLTDFILRDLGLFRYEPYLINSESRFFENRRQIDAHLALYSLLEAWDNAALTCLDSLQTFAKQVLSSRSEKTWETDNIYRRRMSRLINSCARQCERLELTEIAKHLYLNSARPPARERYIRIRAKQCDVMKGEPCKEKQLVEHVSDVMDLCEKLHQHSHYEEEQMFAEAFSLRFAKKYGLSMPQPSPPAIENIRVKLPSSLRESFRNVEQAAMAFLEYGSVEALMHARENARADVGAGIDQPSPRCFYVENYLFNGVFGWLYWQVIFAPVRGAFTHPFQDRPHDLYEDDFLAKREVWFAKAQARLENLGDRRQKFAAFLENNSSVTNPFVRWGAFTEDLVQLAFSRIPNHHWQKIFTRMWRDIQYNRTGFPDLIYFPISGHYQLIEVKGPGDTLQKNQLRWLRYFAEHQIPCKVLHLSWV